MDLLASVGLELDLVVQRLQLVRLFAGAAYDCFRSECGDDL